ncbi:MAG: DNA-3-methyladenine glycosylase [Bacteroidota bacterium]
MRLSSDYYLQADIVAIAQNLLGKILCTNIENKRCAGIIVETEAYAGIIDKASHAYGNRRTSRTEIMFREGGVAYIYLCYGIHHLFNVVTNIDGVPHAALIRAIEPIEGIEYMLERRGKTKVDYTLGNGPGSLSKSLGIHYGLTGISLQDTHIWIEDRGIHIPQKQIIASPRVGVAYAKEDAMLPYRFRIKDNPWTSPAK